MGLLDDHESLKAISIEELEEQATEIGYLTPREFAKLINVAAQQVYTWIRKGVLESEKCKCGRTVIDVAAARASLRKKAESLGKHVDATYDPKYRKTYGE